MQDRSKIVSKKTFNVLLGDKLYSLRAHKGLSQEALALKAEINPAYYGQIERGLKSPTLYTLYKISEALEEPLSSLVPFENNEKKKIAITIDQLNSDKADEIIRLLFELIDKIEKR